MLVFSINKNFRGIIGHCSQNLFIPLLLSCSQKNVYSFDVMNLIDILFFLHCRLNWFGSLNFLLLKENIVI